MRPPPEPQFLARQSYKRRRLMDAARGLPFLGAFLFFMPILWAVGAGTSVGKIYVFAIWVVLIVLAGVISRRLMDEDTNPAAPKAEQDRLRDTR